MQAEEVVVRRRVGGGRIKSEDSGGGAGEAPHSSKPKNSIAKCEQALRVLHRDITRCRRRAVRAESLFESQRTAYIILLTQNTTQGVKNIADFFFRTINDHGRVFMASLGPAINARIGNLHTRGEIEAQIRTNSPADASQEAIILKIHELQRQQMSNLISAWKVDLSITSWEQSDEIFERQQELAYLWRADLRLARDALTLLTAEDQHRVTDLLGNCEKPLMLLEAQLLYLNSLQGTIF